MRAKKHPRPGIVLAAVVVDLLLFWVRAHAQGPAYPVKTISGAFPVGTVDVSGTLLFFQGLELWKSDGSAAGTEPVTTVSAHCLGSLPSEPTEEMTANGLLFFTSAGTCYGGSLWRSDGTAAGTFPLLDYPGPYSGGPSNLVNLNGTLFFSVFSSALAGSGYGIWRSDGTVAGTVLVKDIAPGSAGSAPSSLTNVGGMLFFSANDGHSGRELWKSDGTAAGTVLFQDIASGDSSSDPMSFTVSGSHVFFTADDGSHGRQLWAAQLAATITVNSTTDDTTVADGKCTLREAIANTNAASDITGGDCAAGTGAGDTIVFDLALPATMTLTTATELTIKRDVTIRGPTTGSLAIDGGRGSRVFNVAAGTVRMTELVIQNGSSGPEDGGGLLVAAAASVTLTNCALSGNFGGGLSTAGTATLTDCVVSANHANYGGGIHVAAGGTATLSNTTVSSNTDGLSGQGIFIDARGTATLTNCTLNDNGPSGGGGEGGGLYISAGATATLINCTLSGNYNVGGGGLANFGTATLTNCTLSGNRVNGSDGALANYGTTTLSNTIVANSLDGANCTGTIISLGHNLDSDGTCGFNGAGDVNNTDPHLGPLQDNGGPTLTHALLPGSPAIDAGGPDCPPPTTDQRGVSRPQGTACDLGAYEVSEAACVGDCDASGSVTVDEILALVDIALGNARPATCPQGVPSGADVDVVLILQAVSSALTGCGG